MKLLNKLQWIPVLGVFVTVFMDINNIKGAVCLSDDLAIRFGSAIYQAASIFTLFKLFGVIS